jgi:hypothetical protein
VVRPDVAAHGTVLRQGPALIREIGDDEVAFYLESGWVKLDRLIDPGVAMECGRKAETRIGSDEARGTSLDLAGCLAPAGEEPFHSIAFSDRMGRNAQRLIDRPRLTAVDVPVRFKWDNVVCKFGGVQTRTGYHQDSPHHLCDRRGELMIWIALTEVTPEMGAMRFLTGSHREGCLGVEPGEDLFDHYPRLLELYELSPPLHYQPGDATVHDGCMIHGAPANATTRPRLAYLVAYAPADTRYVVDGEGNVQGGGPGLALPDDGRYPIVYA